MSWLRSGVEAIANHPAGAFFLILGIGMLTAEALGGMFGSWRGDDAPDHEEDIDEPGDD